ncbi:DUF1772 domain-containing protein [Nocardioides sp. cx-169]|uniref:DUF1772 domain-containing protein n=1 Tax=Nocardioides sp. cx-169 TaxID=2899080 RepID=UPI001E54208C|nr:DUF1772 domain-containing protein [Nocardioides sp. cx-169]MCD4533165.1 DUF1772 domain-containing protein [Nocardioides sp. cx-169]
MTTSIAVVALVVTGLLVGVELCVAVFVNPILDRLPGDAGLLGRADGGRVLGRLMPWWYVASFLLCVAVAVLADGAGSTWAAAAGAALLMVSVVISVTLLVPINNRAKTWTPGNAPADWRDQVQRWDRLHYLRVAIITAGFASLALGAVATAG